MEYAFYTYIQLDGLEKKLFELLDTCGFVQEGIPKETAVTLELFQEKISDGIYAIFQEVATDIYALPLAIPLFLEEYNHGQLLHPVILNLEPAFSPILRKSSTKLDNKYLLALRNGKIQQSGRYGIHFGLPDSYDEFAKHKDLIVIRLVGASPGRDSITNLYLWQKQKQVLMNVFQVLKPYYAFVVDETDMELIYTSDIKSWPPLEPWGFLWRMMFFGTELIQRIGQEKLRSLPAYRLEERDAGIMIQASDYSFRDGYPIDVPKLTARDRRVFNESLRVSLDLLSPFP